MPAATKLTPPKDGVTVRMYRQGHGDCFLIAFARKESTKPYYVMIDCGFKPGSGSAKYLKHPNKIDAVVEHLRAACDGHLDLVILTHEHQDHLNGLWKAKDPYFGKFKIEEVWLAWTEDPGNALANELRKRHKDQLLGLLGARQRLAAVAGEDNAALKRIDALLSFELGGAENLGLEAMRAAAANPETSVNKQGMKLIKDKAAERKGCTYLSPGGKPQTLDGTGVRAFILGPPESADLIADEDPRDGEGFPRGHGLSFAAAADPDAATRRPPFGRHHYVSLREAFTKLDNVSPDDPLNKAVDFFTQHYGEGAKSVADPDETQKEAPLDAPWRRIDDEWLYSAETLALKLNTGINNTSLVVAFELPHSKKVLFFAADAQRGNWVSWKDVKFKGDNADVTAKDLMSRAVLYKTGHHGSHNATLSGTTKDKHPNLGWMGLGSAASEFTAMITAVNKWALEANDPPWVHPLPSIKKALYEKTQGRLFQTDQDSLKKPNDVSAADWKRFTDRTVVDDMYFDWQVLDT